MLVEPLFGLPQEGVDLVTGPDVTRCLGQPDRSSKDFGSFNGAVRIEQQPTQIAVGRGVLRIEFDGAPERLEGFSESSHFHQAASQSRPARLVVWVALEKLAESSYLALEDFGVVVGQLEKVTEVASARPAEFRIARLAGESFGFAVWTCLAIRSKEIRILSDLRNRPQRRGTFLTAPPIFFRGLRNA